MSDGLKPRLGLLVNTVAPYRVPVYERLGEAFDLTVFYSAEEKNRDWAKVAEAAKNISIRKSRGITVGVPKRRGGKIIDRRHVHFTTGFFNDLRRLRPKAIISNEMGFRSLSALAAARVLKVPLWIWWGGTPRTEEHISNAQRRVRAFFARSPVRWISYGQTSTDYLRSLGIGEDTIVQIQNCVDPALYSPEGARSVEPSARPALLFVGQLIRRKGLESLLRAAAEVQASGHEFGLLIVGRGPEEEDLKALVAELELRNVEFLGAKRPEEMPSVYRSADALVFPTLEDVWGLVANEAILSGLPVLCSRHAGCAPELVPESDQFDPENHEDFVRALKHAVAGGLTAADPRRLKTPDEVAQIIADDIRRVARL